MTHGDKVKASILDAGLRLWPNVSARAIGRELSMSHSAVLYHFGDSDTLYDAIAAHAVKMNRSAIIVQLCAQKHKSVAGVTEKERQQHLHMMD